MECKATSIKGGSRRRSCSGGSLAEMWFTVAIAGIALAALASFALFSTRSVAMLSNCMELDQENRVALNILTRDIRQCNRLTAFAPNAITVEDADGHPLIFTYDPAAKTLARTKEGVTQVLLSGCQQLTFAMMQRNVTNGTLNYYPTTNLIEAKVIGTSWSCSRALPAARTTLSGLQTATVVIRKQ